MSLEFKRYFVQATPDLVIACNQYPGAPGSTHVLVFSHATGFCKEVWNPVVEELRKLGNKDEILLVDQRSHGDSAVINRHVLPKDAYGLDWHHNATDLLAVISTLYPRPTKKFVAVGHSGGAVQSVLAHLLSPKTFESVICIESVYPDPKRFPEPPLAKAAAKRQNWFASKEAAYQNFKPKPAFVSFDDRSLRAYVEYGLREATPEDGHPNGVVLKCAPNYESTSFKGAGITEYIGKLHEITCPTLWVVGEQSNFVPQIFVDRARKAAANSTWTSVPKASHFVPMEFPATIASIIQSQVHPRSSKL